MIYVGKWEYKKLTKKYPQCVFLYTPTASIGDLCYVRRHFSDILKRNGIEKRTVMLVEDSVKEAGQVLNFQKVHVLSKLRLFPLVMMHTLYGDKIENLFNCYPWEMMYPSHIKNNLKIEKNFEGFENVITDACFDGVKKIILAPHEKTVSIIEGQILADSFWETLAELFKKKGYQVFTNCNRSNSENCIVGTEPINIPLKQMPEMLLKADGFIGIRSGLIDLLCHVPCRQIILYPDTEWLERFGLSTVADNELFEEINCQIFSAEPGRLAQLIVEKF